MSTYKMNDFKQSLKLNLKQRPQPVPRQSTDCNRDYALNSPLVIKEEDHSSTDSFVTDIEEDEEADEEEEKISDDSVSIVTSELTEDEMVVQDLPVE